MTTPVRKACGAEGRQSWPRARRTRPIDRTSITTAASPKPMRCTGCQLRDEDGTPVPIASTSCRSAASVHAHGRRRRAPRDAIRAPMANDDRAARGEAQPLLGGQALVAAGGIAESRGRQAQEDGQAKPEDGLADQERTEHAEQRHPRRRTHRSARGRRRAGRHSCGPVCLMRQQQGQPHSARPGHRSCSRCEHGACHPHPARAARTIRALAEVETLAWLLDNSIPVPGHRRAALRPGRASSASCRWSATSSAAASGCSSCGAASRLGLPRVVVARMLANSAIDLAVGSIPVIGDAFDLWFKANTRNLGLMRRHLEQPELLDPRRVAGAAGARRGCRPRRRAHRLAARVAPHDGGRVVPRPSGVHDRS